VRTRRLQRHATPLIGLPFAPEKRVSGCDRSRHRSCVTACTGTPGSSLSRAPWSSSRAQSSARAARPRRHRLAASIEFVSVHHRPVGDAVSPPRIATDYLEVTTGLPLLGISEMQTRCLQSARAGQHQNWKRVADVCALVHTQLFVDYFPEQGGYGVRYPGPRATSPQALPPGSAAKDGGFPLPSFRPSVHRQNSTRSVGGWEIQPNWKPTSHGGRRR
jgi:hypothetical protein